MIRRRATEICCALKSAGLPAVALLHVVDAALPNGVPVVSKWRLVTAVHAFVAAFDAEPRAASPASSSGSSMVDDLMMALPHVTHVIGPYDEEAFGAQVMCDEESRVEE